MRLDIREQEGHQAAVDKGSRSGIPSRNVTKKTPGIRISGMLGVSVSAGAPGGTRTHDLEIRSLLLYPAGLLAQRS